MRWFPQRRRWGRLLAVALVGLTASAADARPVNAAAPDVSGDTLVVVGDLVPGPGGNLDPAKAVHSLALQQDADARALYLYRSALTDG